MKVAIIHYWFITRRGGEKVVESILKLYPDADIYTLFYDQEKYGPYLEKHKVYSSSLDNTFFRKVYQKIFPLYPIGIRSLKLREQYDLVISSESGPAKGVTIPENTPHICYIHSPMRYAWSHTKMYLDTANYLTRPFLRFFFKRLKTWDKTTVDNVDLYIANSFNVAKRLKKYYQRESVILHPPIEETLFQKPLKESTKEVYLSFGAITPYKKIDLLVDAFNETGKPLVIIGEGSEKEKLIKKAKNNIQFKSCPQWKDVEDILSTTKVLLFPGEEDFGMIPLEVMAYGIPTIAYNKGGALETVIEDKNAVHKSSGIFFEEQTIPSLNNAIQYFEEVENQFDVNWIRNHAQKFTESKFLSKFDTTVKEFIKNKNDNI